MKKLSIVIAIGLGLSACADKDSDFARKYKTGDPGTKQAGTLDKTSLPGDITGQLLCDSAEKIVCAIKVAAVSTSIKEESSKKTLAQVKAKLKLEESFLGSSGDIAKLDDQLRAQVQKELLLTADENYRQIYDYNADLLEAGEIVRDLGLKAIGNKNLNTDDKMKATGSLNRVVFQTLQEAFTTEYLNSAEARKKILDLCGTDGLGNKIYSLTSENSPNSLVGACPGFLLQVAGKSKEQRIAHLVFALSSQVATEIKVSDIQKDSKTLVCLENGAKLDSETISSDLFAAEVSQAYLKTVEDKAQVTAHMLNSLCQSESKEDKERLANFFKLESTASLLGCEKAVRCE